ARPTHRSAADRAGRRGARSGERASARSWLFPRAIPDRRGPGALLLDARDLRLVGIGVRTGHHVAADGECALLVLRILGEPGLAGVRLERIEAGPLAGPGAPAAGGVFEHAGVVERRLPRVPLRVLEHRAERIVPRSGGQAGARVDTCAVIRLSSHVPDLLVLRSRRVEPSLDD